MDKRSSLVRLVDFELDVFFAVVLTFLNFFAVGGVLNCMSSSLESIRIVSRVASLLCLGLFTIRHWKSIPFSCSFFSTVLTSFSFLNIIFFHWSSVLTALCFDLLCSMVVFFDDFFAIFDKYSETFLWGTIVPNNRTKLVEYQLYYSICKSLIWSSVSTYTEVFDHTSNNYALCPQLYVQYRTIQMQCTLDGVNVQSISAWT